MDKSLELFYHPIDLNRLNNIKRNIFKKIKALDVTIKKSHEPTLFKDREINQRRILRGSYWGSIYDSAWFHFTSEIPEEYRGMNLVCLIDVWGEGLIVDSNGNPLLGISHVFNNEHIGELLNPPRGKGIYKLPMDSESVNFWMDAGCNGFGGYNIFRGKLKHAALAIMDNKIYEYYFDYLAYAYLSYTYKGDDKKRAREILDTSYKCFLKHDYIKAHAYINNELNNGSEDELSLSCVGHSHLDLAWLWPMRETHRKAARTLATAVKNMDFYKDYIYGASQPQELVWIKKEYPRLFSSLKDKYAMGQFEPQGGMWVECDTNLPSGESLIRQLLYGMKFWKDEFNADIKNCWLPDVFGYSAQLPQIMKKCGIDYFMSQKLSWNSINEFPLETFNWEGLSSDNVLVHLLPANRYDSTCTAPILREIRERHFKKDKVSKEALVCFGSGDGGGGACECDIELIKRYENTKGLPKLKMEKAQDLFDRLGLNRDKYPVYKGELYLERHQGTYTTQSDIKKYNRKCEQLLHTYEALGAIAIKEGYKYQYDRVERLWKVVLLHQFHDIIPGSSIERVNREAKEKYEEVISELNSLINEVFSFLKRGDSSYSAYNPAPVATKGYLRRKKHWYYYDLLPYEAKSLIEVNPKDNCLNASKNMIENNILSVRFNRNGFIESILDKRSGHEYNKGGMNILNVYKDKRLFFNAWDIDINYTKHKPKHMKLIASKLYVEGLEAIYEGSYKYGRSRVSQKIILRKDLPYIIFDMKCNWHERHKMLRADFRPLSYSDLATCDIQFGDIKRSTKSDNSLDYAKFEICAHKYVDVSDNSFGSAIISNSKYGYRCKDGLMSLNLLRSTTYPDKHADIGKHHFKYAFYPHKGNKDKALVADYAYTFNYKPVILDGEVVIASLAYVDNPNIIIETIKPSEDRMGITLRLYESKGCNNNATISFNISYNKIFESNMREEGLREINRSLCFTPYEIKTIIIR